MRHRVGRADGDQFAHQKGGEMKQQLASGRRIRHKVAWSIVATIAALAALGVGTGLATQGPLLMKRPASAWPAAKAQELGRLQQEMDAARAHPRPKPVAPVPPPHQPDPARTAGIDNDMHQGPFPATEFTVRNFWQGPVGPAWMLVYAGATRDAAGTTVQGSLRLYNEPIDANGDYHLVPIGTYAAPNGAGALTMTAATGDVLSLRTDGGSTLSFNLQTLQFQ